MTDLKHTYKLLDDLQTFLDGTSLPSEALDNLYTDVVKAKNAINDELRNFDWADYDN
jgi:hypothetical protein